MKMKPFEHLIPVLEALDGNKDMLSEVVSLISNADEAKLKNEAVLALSVLKNYDEPKLPFGWVETEKVLAEFARYQLRYGFPIWSTAFAGSDADCARIVRDDPGKFLRLTEDDVRLISQEQNEEKREALKAEFDKIKINYLYIKESRLDNKGCLRAKPFYVLGDQLSDVFGLTFNTVFTLYIQDGDLRVERKDPEDVHVYIIRTFEDGVMPSLSNESATKSLVPYLCEHFGWEIES